MKKIIVDGNTYECNVDPSKIPTIERILKGSTDSDDAIRTLRIPNNPVWLKIIVKNIRWYRRVISPKLGNRCVFEPSCSHYAELAFRKRGFISGLYATINRLIRCRPSAGGIDFP